MVVGGQARARGFSDDNSVLTPEIWNPQTETWREVAAHVTPRNYHSVALLLPDGRVLSGGGGLCGTCPTNHPNIELFSPGYLFNADGSLADRPTILTAPSSTRYGNTFSVTTDAEIERFHLVRLASTTHALNTDQRFLSLEFTRAGNAYTINAPSDSNIALPGYYMLFALDPQGVPSVAKTVRLY
jgi:galactose oxidase